MPKEFSRTDRVAELIQRTLADLIQRKLDEPKLLLTSIVKVKVSKNFNYAKVFITHFNSNENKDDINQTETIVDLLNKQAGRLRFLLGKILFLRVTPQLHFRYDYSLKQAYRLGEIINQIVPTDHDHPQ